MTDAPGMEEPPAPVVVDASVSRQAGWQLIRNLIIAGAASGATLLFHDGVVTGAWVAVVVALLAYLSSLKSLLNKQGKLVQLVNMLPDEMARFK